MSLQVLALDFSQKKNARGEEAVLEPQAQPKDFGLTLEDLQQDGPPLEIVSRSGSVG